MRLTNTACLVTNLIMLATDDKVSLWGTPRYPIPSSTSKVSSSLRISSTSSSVLALESLYRMKKKTIYKSLMTLVYLFAPGWASLFDKLCHWRSMIISSQMSISSRVKMGHLKLDAKLIRLH